MNVPIIKLEVQGMAMTVRTALMEHAAKMDSSIQAAVESYCTPGNIDAVVKKAAHEALDAAVREEVRAFFGYGRAGRQAIREAVTHFLDEIYPLDVPE
jgi:ribosomal protein S3AE